MLGAHVGSAVEMNRVDPDESARFALLFDKLGLREQVVLAAEQHLDAAHFYAVFFASRHGDRIVRRRLAYRHEPRLRIGGEQVEQSVAPLANIPLEQDLVEHVQPLDDLEALARVCEPNAVEIEQSLALERGEILLEIVDAVIEQIAVCGTQFAFFQLRHQRKPHRYRREQQTEIHVLMEHRDLVVERPERVELDDVRALFERVQRRPDGVFGDRRAALPSVRRHQRTAFFKQSFQHILLRSLYLASRPSGVSRHFKTNVISTGL